MWIYPPLCFSPDRHISSHHNTTERKKKLPFHPLSCSFEPLVFSFSVLFTIWFCMCVVVVLFAKVYQFSACSSEVGRFCWITVKPVWVLRVFFIYLFFIGFLLWLLLILYTHTYEYKLNWSLCVGNPFGLFGASSLHSYDILLKLRYL